MTTRSKARWLLQSLAVAVAALTIAPCAWALSPDLRIRQLNHTAWTAKDGAPTGVEFLAQTSDGYLWLAAAAGLFRFDGVRFEHIDSVGAQRLPSSSIVTLFAPRTGGLWIGYRFGGASFIKDGRITSYREHEGLPISSVTRFAQDAAGVVWATTSGGLRRFDGALWEDVLEGLNLPSEYVKSPLYVARDGSLWVVSGHAVMVLRPRASVFAATSIQTSEGEVDFVEAPDGTLWLTDENLGARALYVPSGASNTRQDWIALRNARRATRSVVGQAHRSGRRAMDGIAGRHSSIG